MTKIYYPNMLNGSGVTITASSGSNSLGYLSDWSKLNQWPSADASNQWIKIVPAASTTAGAIIIDNHNLDGCDLELHVSTDDFAANDDTIDSWTQSGNDNILREFTEVDKPYWKLVAESLSVAIKIGELHLSRGYSVRSPARPFAPDASQDESFITELTRGFRYIEERNRRKIFTPEFSMMYNSSYETWLDFWENWRWKPFYFAFNETNSPEDVCLVRDITGGMQSVLRGQIRERFSKTLVECL